MVAAPSLEAAAALEVIAKTLNSEYQWELNMPSLSEEAVPVLVDL